MNTFINMVKRFLEVRGTRDRVGVFRGVRALVETSLLLALDPFARPWAPASLSSSPAGLTGVLTQGLWQAQDPGAIAKV